MTQVGQPFVHLNTLAHCNEYLQEIISSSLLYANVALFSMPRRGTRKHMAQLGWRSDESKLCKEKAAIK